jgi:alkylhydroperoxidase family enzyme
LIRDDEQAEKIINGVLDDYKTAPISEKEKTMLDYAVKLTKEPAAVKKRILIN